MDLLGSGSVLFGSVLFCSGSEFDAEETATELPTSRRNLCDVSDYHIAIHSRIGAFALGVGFASLQIVAGWTDFREIAAWQHSHAAKVRIYDLIERSKIKRDLKLTAQLRESARSAPGNIAEGFGRFGNREFARFCRISKGSLQELLNHLIDAKDLRYITTNELLVEQHHIRKAINAVTGLIRHLETTNGPTENPEPNQNPTEPDPEPGTSNPEPKSS